MDRQLGRGARRTLACVAVVSGAICLVSPATASVRPNLTNVFVAPGATRILPLQVTVPDRLLPAADLRLVGAGVVGPVSVTLPAVGPITQTAPKVVVPLELAFTAPPGTAAVREVRTYMAVADGVPIGQVEVGIFVSGPILPLVVTKTAEPATVAKGDVVRLTVSIFNPNAWVVHRVARLGFGFPHRFVPVGPLPRRGLSAFRGLIAPGRTAEVSFDFVAGGCGTRRSGARVMYGLPKLRNHSGPGYVRTIVVERAAPVTVVLLVVL